MQGEIIVVSGLPRSGTSLMMQMLAAGGIEVLSDGERTADEDNPRGYLELEQVKKIKQHASWLPAARGKAVKMISQLVFDLPATERYRLIIMERDLDEVLASQEKMLSRLGRPALPRDKMKVAFQNQIDRFDKWLETQSQFTILRIKYAELVAEPTLAAESISEFLGGGLDLAAMVASVDPALYRNRGSN
ncbi:MAG: sulfotransferase domain-containing protein [Pirellulales bacterium]